MLAARQLEVVKNCDKRIYRPTRKRGNISSVVIDRLAALAIPTYHPKGSVLFVEGQPPCGVFVLYSGCVKLFTSSVDGKVVILRFADPGELLGLAGAVSGQPYETWAEATEPTQTRFVERRQLVQVMRQHAEVAMQVAVHLGESYCSAIAGMHVMGFSRPARQKLAKFLLDWCESNRPFHDEVGARFILTHEEIAQVIGISRETVTRILSAFRRKELIQWRGRHLVLTDRAGLVEALYATQTMTRPCG
jgi:CRP/FNR family cyclic AMP-dependent transcriptional regulator